MDKKILGIKIGTYCTVLLALLCAVMFWLCVKIVPNNVVTSAIGLIAPLLN